MADITSKNPQLTRGEACCLQDKSQSSNPKKTECKVPNFTGSYLYAICLLHF